MTVVRRNGGFKPARPFTWNMQCHYCDSEADIGVEKDGVTVGVCKTHFREQLEELEETEWLDGLQDELDIDRTE